ncbi:hypothetical protein ACET3Z_029101 [Daucus carota]
MSTPQYHTLDKLKVGVDEYKIKVRVVRLWRGSTRTGEEFKSFNLLLLDHKGQRIHAFVPTRCAEEIHSQLTVGKVFSIKQFVVQLYSQTDKYRVLRNQSQLIFSKDTIIQELADDGVTIPSDSFDFYDHSQLMELTKQTTYLADVVGIIKDYDQLRDLTNKHGKDQKKTNSNVNVTFWDKFGESFDKSMRTETQQPVIIIISGCKVGKWNGEVDLSNSNATKVYLNYKHHSVTHLRKMLANEDFAKKALGKKKEKRMQKVTVEDLKKLGKNAIEGYFLLHVKILSIDPTFGWFYNACTSCEKETKMENPCPICESCNRYVPYPQQKFKFHVIAQDMTGQVQVVLGDREARTVVGRRCSDIADEVSSEDALPKSLLSIVDKDYSIVIQLREMNVVNNFNVYWASNICHGFVGIPKETSEIIQSKEPQHSQVMLC